MTDSARTYASTKVRQCARTLVHSYPRALLLASCLALAIALLGAAAPVGAQELDGPRVFQRCYACHSLDPAEQNLTGPTLRGIFGRRAGTLNGFDYSPALREAGGRGLMWTDETLDRFLQDPDQVVPGVRMGGVRLRDAAERGALIQWLKDAAR